MLNTVSVLTLAIFPVEAAFPINRSFFVGCAFFSEFLVIFFGDVSAAFKVELPVLDSIYGEKWDALINELGGCVRTICNSALKNVF